jgi:nucleoside-diphosphate-sugar epimerase
MRALVFGAGRDGDPYGVKVVVVGATGNCGTSLVRALSRDDAVDAVTGVARRLPDLTLPKVDWAAADIERDDLVPLLRRADAVVSLAWRIQPSHDLDALWRTNVEGTTRVMRATREARVPALVYASSVGTYSPGPKDTPVTETWPTNGIRQSYYARHKAEVERRLDAFERDTPEMRVVRVRPALVFKREAATGIRRLFVGPFLPPFLLHRRLLRVVPDIPGLVVQAVHGDDLADLYRRTILSDARGAFNAAAEPVLDAEAVAERLGARRLPVPRAVARGVMAATWRAHLQPSPPGWLDLGLSVPTMDSSRARNELGWRPSVSALDAFLEVVDGMRDSTGGTTPPLDPATSGRLREREVLTGVGSRDEAAA